MCGYKQVEGAKTFSGPVFFLFITVAPSCEDVYPKQTGTYVPGSVFGRLPTIRIIFINKVVIHEITARQQ